MKTKTLYSFSEPGAADAWRAINDGVMGGISMGGVHVSEEGGAVFSGSVSLENNGGFASVRSLPTDHELEGYDGIRLRVRGDGKRYKLSVKTDDRFDGVQYQVAFATAPGEPLTLDLPFAEFRPVFRGRAVPDAPPLDPAAVRQLGILIADKQQGGFRLEIGSIEAYREP